MVKLCVVCSRLDFAAISFQSLPKYVGIGESFASNHDQYYLKSGSDDAVDTVESALTPYHRTLHSLIDSTKATRTLPDGCQLCGLVLLSIQKALDSLERAKSQGWMVNESSDDDWSFFLSGRERAGTGVSIIGLDNTSNSGKTGCDIIYMAMGVLDFRVEYGSELSHAIRAFKIAQTPCDAVLWDSVKSWIRYCRIYHKHSTEFDMEETTTHHLPARILCITEEEEDFRIVLTDTTSAAIMGDYVALSHCWGQSPTLRLDASNIEKMRSTGILSQDLPQTFQDATKVTRELGYRRLWIDSLCILQDDRVDWEVEAAKMHSIYRYATVVIAASRAVNCASRFLGPRYEPRCTILPYQGIAALHDRRADVQSPPRAKAGKSTQADLQQGHVLAYSYPLQWEFNRLDRLHDEPLSLRGWALQERMLATRTIHFASEGLYLECGSHLIPEKNIPQSSFCVPEEHDGEHPRGQNSVRGHDSVDLPFSNDTFPGDTIWSNVKATEIISPAQLRLSGSHDFRLGLFRSDWNNVVTRFSRRLLTFPSDKLPAIAGMASHFDEILCNGMKSQASRNPSVSTNICESFQAPRYCAGMFLPGEGSIDDLLWRIDLRHHVRLEMNGEQCSTGGACPQRPPVYRAPTCSWASIDGAIEWREIGYWVDLATITSVNVVHLAPENVYGEITAGWMILKTITCELYSRQTSEGNRRWYIRTPGRPDTEMDVHLDWDIWRFDNEPSERLPEALRDMENDKTDFSITVLRAFTIDDSNLAVTIDGYNAIFWLEGIIIKPFKGPWTYGEGFERLGTASMHSYGTLENTKERRDRLKEMLHNGEGGTEIRLY